MVKDEKFQYYGGSLKNPIFSREFTKNQEKGENCLRGGGAWAVCRFKRGLGEKEGIFLSRKLIP